MSVKALQRQLEKKIQKAENKVRQLEFKKIVDRDNYPDHITHYEKNIPLGEERVFRVCYNETKPKTGEPSTFTIDLRKFVKRRRPPKDGQGLWRPVYKQGVVIHPDNWHEIFQGIVDLEMELSDPEDWITVLQDMVNATMKKYPEAFHKGFIQNQKQQFVVPPSRENIIRPSLQNKPDLDIVKSPAQPKDEIKKKSNEETNWHSLKKEKGRKVDPETKDWVMKNL